MISIPVLFAAQVIQTLPPPTASVQSPTDFTCSFLVQDGGRFTLTGRFPEVPAGWDVNRGIPTVLKGDGPPGTIGPVDVKPFRSGAEYRRYYIAAKRPDGGHYNIMFVLFDGFTGVGTIDRFQPDTNGSGTMTSFATGDCEATFSPAKKESTHK